MVAGQILRGKVGHAEASLKAGEHQAPDNTMSLPHGNPRLHKAVHELHRSREVGPGRLGHACLVDL